jgi:hypothetical protein
MNAKNFCKDWVIIEQAADVGPGLCPGGSRFQITKEQAGRYRFVPKAGCGLPAADLERSGGKGQFEYGQKLEGGMRGSFEQVGTLLFTLNKLSTKRYVISLQLIEASKAKRRGGSAKSHGGPHGVDS